ncbi:hypothetical protein ACFY6U_33180 [Streptomyces sp. NPDC013157]|uniref:hypothetical protein n=1 Tax=Streptomyces sp. NPDC013157 TaxID=3364861 RepID=UPI00369BAA0A
MTSPAVLSGAAVRVLRTAPGRRALQLALLVGGLLALGFLCGQQAQAAEGVPSTPPSSTSTAPSLTSAVTRRLPLRDVVTPHREPGAAPKSVVKAVPVVDGVGDVVRSVTGTVSDTVTGTVTSPVVSALTETVRQVTELPAVPVVQVPELPVVSDPPAESDPNPVTPVPGRTQAQPRTPVAHDAGHEKPRTQAATAAAATTAASYGPRITAATVTFASGKAPHTGTRRAGRAADAPAHPAPAGDPDGALGKSAVDGAASRHGDVHAVTSAGRAPLRHAPGAAARLDAAGTRDRYRDIPLFPG